MACSSRDEEGASCSADAHKALKYDPAESSTEWRSWEQLEASPASTSPPWDSGDDNSSGSSVSRPRPSDLYGKYTWKIENFSQISKRELRSSVFEVGSYKWYILVYPQGCDVCNHLSLFLCVADYDKLLPGWSHFAQFTIAVVNKDPKKSKYSDTLHRFCKKEHDWGWKKFMELSKVLDGFTVADTLVIKAQVQVIRENPHRPFRCLDCQYRRELVRVYLTNVEGICRRFLEEKREKIGKLMEDTIRWSSFRGFWLAVEESVRRRLSREKIDTVLKAIVKCFFNEKEVTSTLVMDALYSGCKALGYHSKNKKGKINGVELEVAVNPVVWVDKEFFVLAGDVLLLLERAANESLPFYRDDKGPQNRTKDGGSGDDFGKDSVERDERRLTELGRRTVEMFVLAHLFSNRVEVAYLEAIALKRQEELIREEEAAGQAEIELKARREASEKEKRTKKKQAKQRRNNRKEKEKEKEKEKGVEEKLSVARQEPFPRGESTTGKSMRGSLLKGSSTTSVHTGDEDDDSSVLDSVDGVVGTLRPAVDDGDVDAALWEREGSDVHPVMEASFSGGLCVDSSQNGRSSRKHQTLLDDSSSTCSSDSIPCMSGITNGSSRRKVNPTGPSSNLTIRGPGRRVSEASGKELRLSENNRVLQGRMNIASGVDATSRSTSGGLDAETVIASLKQQVQWLQQRLQEKEEEVVMLYEQLSLYQHHYGSDIVDHEKKIVEPVDVQQKLVVLDRESSESAHEKVDSRNPDDGKVPARNTSTYDESRGNEAEDSAEQPRCSIPDSESQELPSTPGARSPPSFLLHDTPCVPKSVTSSNHSNSVPRSPEPCLMGHSSQLANPAIETGLSRPSSAPGLATSSPVTSFSMLQQQTQPQTLARSVSAIGRLGATTMEQLSIGPAIQQGTSAAPSYRNAAAGLITSSHTAPSSSRIHGSAGTLPHSNGPIPNGGLSHAKTGPGSSGTSASSSHAHTVSASFGQATGVMPRIANEEAMLQAALGKQLSLNGEGFFSMEMGEDISSQRPEHGPPTRVGLTFGTVTPEMLHVQQQQQQHREEKQQQQERLGTGGLSHSEHLEERQNGEHHHQSQVHTSTFGCEPQKNIVILQRGVPRGVALKLPQTLQMRPESTSGAVMSEDFPHLDIINELLDDDKVLGARALNALMQQPGNHGFQHQLSIHDLQRMYARQLQMEMAPIYGNGAERSERVLHGEDGSRPQLTSPLDHTQCNPREGMHVAYPYTHSPLPHSYSHHGGSIDGMSGHEWPGVHNDMPVSRCASGPPNGMDYLIGYPMQSPHISVADCPPYNQNGYSMYAPINHP